MIDAGVSVKSVNAPPVPAGKSSATQADVPASYRGYLIVCNGSRKQPLRYVVCQVIEVNVPVAY